MNSRKKIMDGASLAADITDAVFFQGKSELVKITIDYNSASTATGDFILQSSHDYDGVGTPSDFTWVAVGSGTTVTSAAAAGARYSQEYRGLVGWYRLFYDAGNSPSETVDAWVESSSVR